MSGSVSNSKMLSYSSTQSWVQVDISTKASRLGVLFVVEGAPSLKKRLVQTSLLSHVPLVNRLVIPKVDRSQTFYRNFWHPRCWKKSGRFAISEEWIIRDPNKSRMATFRQRFCIFKIQENASLQREDVRMATKFSLSLSKVREEASVLQFVCSHKS